jgi:hypothetical protein
MNFQRSILRLAMDTVPGAATAAEAVGFKASSIAVLSLLATVGLGLFNFHLVGEQQKK